MLAWKQSFIHSCSLGAYGLAKHLAAYTPELVLASAVVKFALLKNTLFNVHNFSAMPGNSVTVIRFVHKFVSPKRWASVGNPDF